MKTDLVYTKVDQWSTNPAMSHNGGDYHFGRTVVIDATDRLHARYWASADFDYCGGCGRFDYHELDYHDTFQGSIPPISEIIADWERITSEVYGDFWPVENKDIKSERG